MQTFAKPYKFFSNSSIHLFIVQIIADGAHDILVPQYEALSFGPNFHTNKSCLVQISSRCPLLP